MHILRSDKIIIMWEFFESILVPCWMYHNLGEHYCSGIDSPHMKKHNHDGQKFTITMDHVNFYNKKMLFNQSHPLQARQGVLQLLWCARWNRSQGPRGNSNSYTEIWTTMYYSYFSGCLQRLLEYIIVHCRRVVSDSELLSVCIKPGWSYEA